MTRTLIIAVYLLGITAAFILTTTAAQAQTVCGKRADMVEQTAEKYGETRHGGGMVGNQAIIELYVSDETGTWTIFQTTPNGVTCLVAAGDNWHDDTVEMTPTGNPA